VSSGVTTDHAGNDTEMGTMSQQGPPQVPPRPTQVKVGRVVSDKMDKTVLVDVQTYRRHALYGRITRHSKRYMVHDETNSANVGDEVRFCLCRPISRHKTWILMEITRRSRGQAMLPEESTSDYRETSEELGDHLAAEEAVE
jgi:small subunit ribosomal protein S17